MKAVAFLIPERSIESTIRKWGFVSRVTEPKDKEFPGFPHRASIPPAPTGFLTGPRTTDVILPFWSAGVSARLCVVTLVCMHAMSITCTLTGTAFQLREGPPRTVRP